MVAIVTSAVVFLVPPPARAASTVGSFEIDGNLVDPVAGEPIDWATPPPNLTNFTDLAASTSDDSFGGGSKELEPGQWSCTTNKAPGKDDITAGQVAFRTFGGKQFIYVDYTRAAASGDAHIDYEFNASSLPNPACPALPMRTNGDIVIAFDTENGGAQIFVRAFRWTFTGPGVGTFTELPTGSQEVTFDGAVNIPNTIPGHVAGDFGEAALNLTDTIGSVSCGQFSSVYMKSRSSTAINSALQDRTTTQPVALGDCPNSALAKAVRNVTTGTGFATSVNASPGNILEYRLRYSNTGAAAATNVVITDTIAPRQTFQSCTNGCANSSGTLTWTFPSIAAGATQDVFFRVLLDSVFPSGDTPIPNVGSVDTSQEPPKSSNTTTVTVSASAVLSSVKTVSPTTAAVGGTVTYTVKVTNSGGADATTNVVDDYDQAHITVSNISNGGVDNGNTISWANLAVPAGQTVTLTYSGLVKGSFSGTPGPNCTDGHFPVVNTVTVSGGTGSEATLCVNAAPILTTTKTVSPTSAAVGGSVTYTVKVTNSGAADATTTVTDDYDQAHIAVSNISNGGSDNGNAIIWTDLPVPAGQTVTLTYTGIVKGTFSGPPGGGGCGSGQFPVVNTVTITGGTGANATLCVNAAPNLTSDKTVNPTTATVGQTVAYKIVITNSGAADGTTTVVDDYDQAHITVSNISNGGINNGDTITWTNLLVPAGQTVTLTYDGTVKGTFSGSPGGCGAGQFPVSNSVTITGGAGDSATLCVAAAPVLSSTKSVNPTSANVGGSVTYTITVTNSGAADGTTTITDDYDQDHITPSNISNGGSSNGDKITWSNVTVAAGQSVVRTYTGTVIGTFAGSSGGGGCGSGQFPVLNSVTITGGTGSNATLCVNASPNLTSDKTVSPTTASVGQTVAYSVKVTNSGAAGGTTTVVDDYDQAHITVSNVSNGGVDNGDTITWTDVSVPAGQNVTLTYSGLVKGTFSGPPGTGCGAGQFPVLNSVTITGGTGDSATLCVNAAPSFSSDKTVNPTTASVGGTVTYSIKVTNSGAADGTTTVVDDYDQTHISVSNISNSGVNNGNTITWGSVSVPAGQTVTLTYDGTVIGTFAGPPGAGCGPGQFPVVNQVSLTPGSGDTNTLCVNAAPAITTDKTVTPTTATPGQAVTYKIVITNSGDAAGTTTVTDNYDQAHITVSNITGGGVNNGDTIVWSNVVVGAGQMVTFTYTGTIGGSFTGTPPAGCGPNQFPVVNQVTLTVGSGDTNTLCVNTSTTLTVSKSACPTTVVPGGLLTYTIAFNNTGTIAATNVVLVDTIPTGTEVAHAGGGTVNGNQVTWNVGTVNAGTGGTRTLVVLVNAANGTVLTNSIQISADNAATATATAMTSVTNAGAITHGAAYGLDVDLLGIPLINELGRAASVAPGSPQADTEQLLGVGVPLIATANIIRQTSNSSVTDQAVSTATSEVLGLNLLSGAITADVIRGVSQSVATPTAATSNSTGSSYANLKINGNSIGNVPPNTKVTVKNPLIPSQNLAEVVINEEVKSATFVGGKFTATHSVNTLRVTLLKAFLTLPKGAEIIVAHANTDATYPSGLACGTAPATVSANAFIAFAEGTFFGTPIVTTQVGDASITPLGGSDSDAVASVLLPPAAVAGVATDSASGSISPNPNAQAQARVAGASLLNGLITADVLDVQSSSTSNGTTASTTFTTTFLNVKVGTLTLGAVVPPNTTIAVPSGGGIILVILNEQIRGGNGTKDTEGTINAVHAYILNSSNVVTAELIVASAHSDAHRP
ncbi:MAG: beta strand repeat-containing protein [Acidimicrobiales bacterium]